MDAIKEFLVGILVRWLLKVAGGALVTWGIANPEGTLTAIVGGIVAIIIGIITSLVQSNNMLKKEPVK